MPIFSVFKTLVGKSVKIELKNGMLVEGAVKDVDIFLNIKVGVASLEGTQAADARPLAPISVMFVRGTSIKFVFIKNSDVSIPSLEASARKSFLFRSLPLGQRGDREGGEDGAAQEEE